MSKSSEAVKRWRQNTKRRMVESMGGCCVCCGYNNSLRALTFHHLDPTQKEMGFGQARGNPTAWKTIISELKKCVCVCYNCHMEIHDGLRGVPVNPARFNEQFSKY